MNEQLPAPFVPAEVDLRDFPYMALHVAQLLDSETWLLATGDEAKAAVTLWCKAWHQRPAASLPNDDRILAALSGAGTKWKKVKEVALRGFTLCSDGRLYHKTIAETALDAWASKVSQRERTRAATEAREKKRRERERAENGADEQRDVQRSNASDDKRDEQRDVHQRERERERERETLVIAADARGAGASRNENPKPEPWRAAADRVLDVLGVSVKDPNWYGTTGVVAQWLADGADMERDILPAVTALLAKARDQNGPHWLPKSLRYFTSAIAETRVANTHKPTIPEAQHGQAQTKPESGEDLAARILARRGGKL